MVNFLEEKPGLFALVISNNRINQTHLRRKQGMKKVKNNFNKQKSTT